MNQNALSEFRKLREKLSSERDSLTKRLAQINEALGVVEASSSTTPKEISPRSPDGKRRMSAAARRKIAEGQRLRWAKRRGESTGNNSPAASAAPPKKRTMSAAQRAKISAAAKARWAKVKKEGKTRL